MTTRTLASRKPWLACMLSVWLGLAGCSDGGSPTGPDPDGEQPPEVKPIEELPATQLTQDDLTPTGNVTPTDDGYGVQGELTIATSDTGAVTLANADLDVRFDPQGRVRSISGRAEIASPHERIQFEDPVRAEVGFFPGWWLNQTRDLGIVLQDDTDYFVYDFEVRLQMNVATGETGESATHPISVQAPLGGRTIMIIDYADPMYYVYGQQDLLNQRIPFRPSHQVPEIQGGGNFDGGSIRVGSFPVFKIIKISGTTVDNEYTEVHMSMEDPLSSDLRTGYRQGHDGAMEFDLGIKDMVGISLPLASASGGVWFEASTSGLQGHAYASGETDQGIDWWPSFLPVKPAVSLSTHSYVSSEGPFQLNLEGTYGWEFPDGEESMTGVANLANDGMRLEGISRSGDIEWVIGAHLTTDQTRAYVQPPQELLDEIGSAVNDEVLPKIDEAEAAWNDLQDATKDYEFELSLRGLREDIPPMVDEGARQLKAGVDAAIRGQKGKVWYNDFRKKIQAADNVYYTQLAQLRAAALDARDNATTRNVLERELREMAARKIFTFKYRYKDPIFGKTLYSTTVTRRILSDSDANALIKAANNVPRIQETSDEKIRMEQVYQSVNERELFEQVRDDLQDGLLIMRTIDELGFVIQHGSGAPSFAVYAVIDGKRYAAGTIGSLTVEEFLTELPNVMLEALKVN
jgi:hypothetical protein